MAFLEFKNVRISGISAGVPKHIEYNKDYPYFEAGEAEKYIASTSIRERRIADPGVCSSDIYYRLRPVFCRNVWDCPRVATPWIYPWAALVGFMV